MNTKNCKEELINITTALINENNGDVDKVTIRDITSRSGVSVGLINYHFGSKDNLIAECVQRIITGIIANFKPNIDAGKDNTEPCRDHAYKGKRCQILFKTLTRKR